ncbi:MAG TPA: BBP7 family outer membrane beta-barrel protein [Planctomycetaceae bacterium]|nr:BBP7 family outer membrane beta-barrel protein [Planctomycetaceae bacterium]
MVRWCPLTALLLAVCLPQFGLAQPPAFPIPDQGVVQAGWKQGGYGGYPPPGYGMPRGPGSPGNTTFVELPDDKGFAYEGSPFDKSITNLFSNGSIRLEYLLWDISNPGRNILGADVASPDINQPDPTQPFDFLIPGTLNQTRAVTPSLQNVNTNDNNGIRGTYELPFRAGSFEASIFALQKSHSAVPIPEEFVIDLNDLDLDLQTTDSINAIGAIYTPLLINGVVPLGGLGLVWDQGYRAELQTRVWGTEGNWVANAFDPGSPLQIRPIIGIRMMEFAEDLRQIGAYNFSVTATDGTVTTSVVNRKISSTTDNYMYGPQFGFRSELVSRWVSFGAQPKVMLGMNSYKAKIQTLNILSPTDINQNLEQTDTTFGIIGDLEVYSKIHVRPHFNLFVGYNLLWTGLITRPAENIVYNVSGAVGGAGRQSDFGLDLNYSGALLQGLSVGGELTY